MAEIMNKEWTEDDVKKAFFPVELRPIFIEDKANMTGYRQLPRHLAVIDLETNTAFSVVTEDYKLVTNKEAYEQASKIMQKVFNRMTSEHFACLKVIMPSSRSFCHIDLIYKNNDFEPFKDDNWTPFIRITNSYNRTKLLRYELGFCRWMCSNGMIFGAKSVEYSSAHTKANIENVQRFSENIGDIRKLEQELILKLQNLQRFFVPREKMLAIVCKTFDIKIPDLKELNLKPKRKDSLIEIRNQVEKLTENYFAKDQLHGYSALNVLTDYATNPTGVIAKEANINSFQQKCGEWIENFTSAIQVPNFSFEIYLNEHQITADVISNL